MTDYSAFPSSPPGTTTNATATPLSPGCTASVTTGGVWLKAYRWWVNASGQDTGAMKFCLWQVNGASGVAALVPGTTVTSGTMTAGAWNNVTLGTPVLLAPGDPVSAKGAVYTAAGGRSFTTGWPEVQHQFGAANPYSAGIVNGPLTVYSSTGGSLPAGGAGAWGKPQQPYALIADPTGGMPTVNDNDAWLGMDWLVTTTAPPGAVYRTFSAAPLFVVPGVSAQSSAYTLGYKFHVTQRVPLLDISHYSPPGATILPSRCGIWDAGTQLVVSGTDNQSPAWSGAAASGWVRCDYSASGVTLQPGKNYIASTFTANNSSPWFLAQTDVFGAGSAFPSGITCGPLVIDGVCWNLGTTWTFPATTTTPTVEYDGVDLTVGAPVTSGSGLLMASGIA